MRDLAFVGIAGALGACSRYGVGLLAARYLGARFAWGTLLVNVTGCFLLALLLTVGLANEAIPREVKLALGTGFLGAFTTFSTFGYETLSFVERGETRLAIWNVAANLVLGLIAAAVGLGIGKAILERMA